MSGEHLVAEHLVEGTIVAAAAAAAYNVGFAVEKRALGAIRDLDLGRPVSTVRSLIGSPLWCAGFATMLVGLGLQVLALTLVPISVVQPVLASGLGLLAVASHVFLGERLSRREWVAVALIVVALVAVGASESSSTDQAGDHADLLALVVVGLPALVLGGALFSATSRRRPAGAPGVSFGLGCGLVYGVAALATKAVAAPIESGGLIAGVLHDVTRPYVYILGLTSLGGLLMFQTGLQRCRAAVVVPVSNVTSGALAVIAGTVVFGESLPPAWWQELLRIGGFAAILTGAVLLSLRQPTEVSHPSDAAGASGRSGVGASGGAAPSRLSGPVGGRGDARRRAAPVGREARGTVGG